MKLDIKSVITLLVMLSAYFGAQLAGWVNPGETVTSILAAVVTVISNLLNPIVAKKGDL